MGGVGSCVLSQLSHISKAYPRIRVLYISRSSKCIQADDPSKPLSLDTWRADLEASAQPVLPIPALVYSFIATDGDHVIVDNTSSEQIATEYPEILSKGISIVTPNKKAFSGPQELWDRIVSGRRSPEHPFRGMCYHESSVGAGLPVIGTLNDLVATGDRVTRIAGVFSGTLSFLFNAFAPVDAAGPDPRWSEAVAKAKELGYTEPDPRDDLNGRDVARKLVILARIVGLKVDGPDAFPVQSLIPEELKGVESGEEFLARLGEFDGKMERAREEARAEGKVVRFVGSVNVAKGGLRVSLENVDRESAIAGLKGSDNIVSFYTERYGERPLVIQGAG